MTVTIDPLTAIAIVGLLISSGAWLIWLGKLSNRVDRLESDVAELKEGQQKILGVLNRHVGFHEGLTAISAGIEQPAVSGELSGRARSHLGGQ